MGVTVHGILNLEEEACCSGCRAVSDQQAVKAHSMLKAETQRDRRTPVLVLSRSRHGEVMQGTPR